MNRVVFSGMGVVSPVGSSIEEFFSSIETCNVGVNLIKNIPTDNFPVSFGAEAKDKDEVIKTPPHIDRKELFINRAIEQLFAKHSFIHNISPEKRMLHLGAGIDYFNFIDYVNNYPNDKDNWRKYCRSSHSAVEDIVEKFHISGGHSVNVSACAASSQSMGLAYRVLKSGNDSLIITGGFDSMLSHLHYMGFQKLGALSNWSGEPAKASRPFDNKRCGLVIGEGAAVFILQNEKDADTSSILAEIAGFSSTADAYMVTDPEPSGSNLAQCALNAIKEADISPDDIDCVHVHGTGTIKNEIAECNAMKKIFGSRFTEIPVYSMKAQVGHLIGACGAVEMLGVIYSLINQKIPPTANYEFPDPAIPLNVIKEKPLEMNINYVLKLNAGFGGQNTAFVVKKYGK